MIEPTKCLCTQRKLRSAWAASQFDHIVGFVLYWLILPPVDGSKSCWMSSCIDADQTLHSDTPDTAVFLFQVSHPSSLDFEVGQMISVKYFGRDPASGKMRISRKVISAPSSRSVDLITDKKDSGDIKTLDGGYIK